MLIPKCIQPGDTIGVVSPSNPVTPEYQRQYEAGITFLQEAGFVIQPGNFTHSTSWNYAAAPLEKAADINSMFANPDIKAIICTQGGDTANAVLPYLDWEIIQANPKIFVGISDITVLLNAIHAKTGLITFHCNDVIWGYGNEPGAYDLQEFEDTILQGKLGTIPPNGSRQTIRPGIAEGKCLGGNLRCLLKLAGTPYLPDFQDAIIFLEAYLPTASSCDYFFQQMLQMGIFDQINGVVVGYIDGLQNNPDAAGQMEDILARITADKNFPILKINDFGHNCQNTTLPIGARVRIDSDYQTIERIEPYLL